MIQLSAETPFSNDFNKKIMIQSIIAESTRLLRTFKLFIMIMKIIKNNFSYINRGEGKTFIAFNIAKFIINWKKQ